MAGGLSLRLSSDAKTDPREIFNARLLYLLVTVAWAGSLYGFDTGNIGGILTLPSFQHAFHLTDRPQYEIDDRRGTIAAMLPAAGSVGALLAAPSADFCGRKWSVLIWGVTFVLGAALQMVADYHTLLVGRFVAGLGVGASSMLTPQFLAENAPKSVRGSMIASYNLMVIASLTLAFFVNYGVSLWNHTGPEYENRQWRVAMSIQIIPGALMCIMIPFVPETPRYLISRGKNELGLKNLCKLRQLPAEHPYVQIEYGEILAQVAYEQETRAGRNYSVVLQDIFTVRSNLQRLFLAVMLFLFHKLTGTDCLNYYAPQIFALIGGAPGSGALLTTGVYGGVKFAAAIIYVAYLVDRVGRRIPLLIGATLQATCLLYLAMYVKISSDRERNHARGGTAAGGYAGMVMIYLYAIGWSFGHAVACYVTAAEIFPSRIRSFCMSTCFFLNWIVDFGITRATPHMLRVMGWATFLLFSALTYLGVAFIFFCLPELKGRSIESMDDLFERPLWRMWRCAYSSEQEKVRHGVQERVLEAKGQDEGSGVRVEGKEGGDVVSADVRPR